MTVPGRGKPLRCWKTAGHGSQTLTQAVQHSCNVAFATPGAADRRRDLLPVLRGFWLFPGERGFLRPSDRHYGDHLAGGERQYLVEPGRVLRYGKPVAVGGGFLWADL